MSESKKDEASLKRINITIFNSCLILSPQKLCILEKKLFNIHITLAWDKNLIKPIIIIKYKLKTILLTKKC